MWPAVRTLLALAVLSGAVIPGERGELGGGPPTRFLARPGTRVTPSAVPSPSTHRREAEAPERAAINRNHQGNSQWAGRPCGALGGAHRQPSLRVRGGGRGRGFPQQIFGGQGAAGRLQFPHPISSVDARASSARLGGSVHAAPAPFSFFGFFVCFFCVRALALLTRRPEKKGTFSR